MPALTAALRFRSKAGSTKRTPCVALDEGERDPGIGYRGQSIAPL